MEQEEYHVPVMLNDCIDALAVKPNGVYVDVTLGGGGHSAAIRQQLGPEGRLFSFDQDADAIAHNAAVAEKEQKLRQRGEWTLVRSNFRYLKNWMRYYGVEQVDGILADLGVSSHHFDESQRGFSFRFDAPLDMRMNQQARRTAADIVQDSTEQQLTDIFRLYGELKQARKLAAAIVKERQHTAITTTGVLAQVVAPILGADRERKDMAKVFQALRIEVNGEMAALQTMLQQATDLLRPGGRLVVMSYHSLEDRIVKNHIRGGESSDMVRTDIYGHLTTPLKAVGKTLTPSAEELASNPRSRSAKLRVAEKQ
ncbi:MAG: 16S rRNA (cytosine(1402)-N(4))-methyltransferase RsmH [Bacteroidaceae bacterium]|nr:16S rRNA (cytosine(1402)-N(4))-methyltransferase RsmH [Bacteroidaceae bacterium]